MVGRLRRKNNVKLNVMVVGREGVGKSTFLRTLVSSLALKGHAKEGISLPRPNPSVQQVVVHQPIEVEVSSTKFSLTLIDTPGLAYSTHQGNELAIIMSYIESQFETRLIEELKVKRNSKISDTTVHAVLYLLPPMQPFHPVDLSAIRTLSNRTNVIPLLAHADSITNSQLSALKASILGTLSQNIDLLEFASPENEYDGSYDDEDHQLELYNLKQALPFTVIGAEFPGDNSPDKSPYLNVNGTRILGREYKWGVVNCCSPDHCEMDRLKFLLFEFSLSALCTYTRNIKYEGYRTERLMAHAGKGGNNRIYREE